MRILLIGSALACIVLQFLLASPTLPILRDRNSYSSCYCYFGYPDHPL